MSQVAMTALRAAADRDEALRARLTTATGPEDVVRIAGEAGFDVTIEDLPKTDRSSGELSQAELDSVAGGMPNNFDTYGYCFF